MKRRVYGYGIVGKSGAPWWDESCVCEDREPLDDQVDMLNEPPHPEHADTPYRVVRLFYLSKGKR